MFRELDLVKTIIDINEQVPKGTIGVVHQSYSDDLNVYLVEFFDKKNNTICILDVNENQIETATG